MGASHMLLRMLELHYGSYIEPVSAIAPVSLKVFFDFLLTVKAAPHECVIRTGQPKA